MSAVSNTWIAPNLFGEGPDAREGHGAALVDKRIFIFGGCGKSETQEEKYYNDVYILDTGSFPHLFFLQICMEVKFVLVMVYMESSSSL